MVEDHYAHTFSRGGEGGLDIRNSPIGTLLNQVYRIALRSHEQVPLC